MKIGIITFHHATYSYGAMLQALATCLVCKNYTSDVELINYENQYEQRGVKAKGATWHVRLQRLINYWMRMYIYSGRKNPFLHSSNIDKVYERVSPQYHDLAQMSDLEYDVLITGSDQVWNPQITGYIDPAFFLNFGKADKRISYAPSMGTYAIPEQEMETFRRLLSHYDAISVREQFAKEQLQPLCQQEIKVVIDPTLLLTKEQWLQHFNIIDRPDSNTEPYILTFFVGAGLDSYWDEVEAYKDYYQLPIWNIQAHKRKSKHTDRVVFVPSVKEFLQLINGAAVIITNSFHGTAFSINFGKEFIPILARKNPARVQNLLNKVGLEDRIKVPTSKLSNPINYQQVWERLNDLREDSLTWLDNKILND